MLKIYLKKEEKILIKVKFLVKIYCYRIRNLYRSNTVNSLNCTITEIKQNWNDVIATQILITVRVFMRKVKVYTFIEFIQHFTKASIKNYIK